eukprot:gene24897-biopygen14987
MGVPPGRTANTTVVGTWLIPRHCCHAASAGHRCLEKQNGAARAWRGARRGHGAWAFKSVASHERAGLRALCRLRKGGARPTLPRPVHGHLAVTGRHGLLGGWVCWAAMHRTTGNPSHKYILRPCPLQVAHVLSGTWATCNGHGPFETDKGPSNGHGPLETDKIVNILEAKILSQIVMHTPGRGGTAGTT